MTAVSSSMVASARRPGRPELVRVRERFVAVRRVGAAFRPEVSVCALVRGVVDAAAGTACAVGAGVSAGAGSGEDAGAWRLIRMWRWVALPRARVWVPGEFRRMACRVLAHRLAALAAAKSVQA
jgi:hypothetical protein